MVFGLYHNSLKRQTKQLKLASIAPLDNLKEDFHKNCTILFSGSVEKLHKITFLLTPPDKISKMLK
jgi:hypothetical protein